MLWSGFASCGIDEMADHVSGESGDGGDEFMECCPVAHFQADEDVGIEFFESGLAGFHVFGGICDGGCGAVAGEPLDVPSDDLERFRREECGGQSRESERDAEARELEGFLHGVRL